MTKDKIVDSIQRQIEEMGVRALTTKDLEKLQKILSKFKEEESIRVTIIDNKDLGYDFEVETFEQEKPKKQRIVFGEGSENLLKEILGAFKAKGVKPPMSFEKTFPPIDKEFEKYVNGLYNDSEFADSALTSTSLNEEYLAEITADMRRKYAETIKAAVKNSSFDNISVLDMAKILTTETEKQNCLISDIENTFEECLEIVKRKNKDYGETEEDPYKNFRNSESVGVSPEKAILVRISDKLSRISTLLSQDAEVKQETIDDTINDAINYFAILKSFLKNN